MCSETEDWVQIAEVSHEPQAATVANGMHFLTAGVAEACRQHGRLVRGLPATLDPVQLMWAIANNESVHHARQPELLFCEPRFEPAWYIGGGLCNPEQQRYCDLFGKDAAKSYGPWQVMYWHCHGSYKPEEFRELENCVALYLMFMDKWLPYWKPPGVQEVLAMYNCGQWYHHPLPAVTQEYVKRGLHWYYESEVPC